MNLPALLILVFASGVIAASFYWACRLERQKTVARINAKLAAEEHDRAMALVRGPLERELDRTRAELEVALLANAEAREQMERRRRQCPAWWVRAASDKRGLNWTAGQQATHN